jgi:hypothetical protein
MIGEEQLDREICQKVKALKLLWKKWREGVQDDGCEVE